MQNQLRSVTNVPAGPFRLDNVPVILGAGEARVVVRDALGRERIVSTPFYAAGGLLRPGPVRLLLFRGAAAHDRRARRERLWQRLRRCVMAPGRQRHADPRGARGEWEEGATRLLGAGADVGGASARSRSRSRSRTAGGGARNGARLPLRGLQPHVALRWEQAQDGFRLAGDAPADPTPTRNVNPSRHGGCPIAGASPPATSMWRGRASIPRAASTCRAASRLRAASRCCCAQPRAGWRFRPQRHQCVPQRAVRPAHVRVRQRRRGSEQRQSAGIQQALPVAEGYGYRLLATRYSDGTRTEAGASAQWRSPRRHRIVRDRDGSNAGRVNLAGGLAFVDGHAFAARPIQDSFILVSTAGVPDAPILLNNQPAGATDASGL